MYPEALRYTPAHEWVGGEDGATAVRVGITFYAQDALGDVVYVSLPTVGTVVIAGEPCGELESTKSVSDVFAPLSGTVSAINDLLDGNPEFVNSDPYGQGWLFEMTLSEPDALSALMDSVTYQASLSD